MSAWSFIYCVRLFIHLDLISYLGLYWVCGMHLLGSHTWANFACESVDSWIGPFPFSREKELDLPICKGLDPSFVGFSLLDFIGGMIRNQNFRVDHNPSRNSPIHFSCLNFMWELETWSYSMLIWTDYVYAYCISFFMIKM